ncbi:hypothetical protein ABZ439_15275 [Streptomyces sp. NPDC005840]|uniref:Uncharacterized protein n=1 Tax=Streptomyces doudnae TaxID=3075536 RepID=A0ABD5EVE0_9ACTN|nr:MULTISPECIES: hypothetical protein [unclassified Streptomyces]MDT0438691.1 hypothetical protein [Streptomyces sp. DSM 41981]MYQ69123.1 hypothetical protein [Streptomyces sp. SID4950]
MFAPARLHPARAERHRLDQPSWASADLLEISLADHDAGLYGLVIQTAYRRALSCGNVLARAQLTAPEQAPALPAAFSQALNPRATAET